jgi:hypothetical protein
VLGGSGTTAISTALAYRSFATTVSQLKMCDFSGETLNVLKCCNFPQVQRRHNCSPAASFANCVMTLYLLKVHLPVTQKCQILSWEILVANERYDNRILYSSALLKTYNFVHFLVEYKKHGARVQYSETLLMHIWKNLTD